MQNIRCVTYKDEFSSENCAYNDLEIGIRNSVVGCGSSVFGASKPGDIVLINAIKDKKRYVVIGLLSEKLEYCDAWVEEGGRRWDHNYKYTPITSMFQYDFNTEQDVQDLCKTHSLNKNNLFNSRFCSKKLKVVIDRLIEKFKITT